jgi:four helix bundle protein
MQRLRVYSLSMKLYREVLGLKLPRHLSGQIRRSAASIGQNISEGSARRTPDDQRRFFFIALGSAKETACILEQAGVRDAELLDCADHVCASLYRLCHNSPGRFPK